MEENCVQHAIKEYAPRSTSNEVPILQVRVDLTSGKTEGMPQVQESAGPKEKAYAPMLQEYVKRLKNEHQ